jgi:hypothetical protein
MLWQLRVFAFHAVCPRSLRTDVLKLYVVVVVDEGSIPDHQWWMEEVPSTTFLPGASLPVGRDQSLSCMKMRIYTAGIIASGTRLLHSLGDRLTKVLDLSDQFVGKARDDLAIRRCHWHLTRSRSYPCSCPGIQDHRKVCVYIVSVASLLSLHLLDAAAAAWIAIFHSN